MVTSILTVGFGGSAGLESPIASTGSAIGSVVARRFGFGTKERILLLACGAAAGISAIFNAPIAGVIFALEILLVDMPLPVVVPILISSATAALFSRFIFSGQPFVLITDSWNASHIFYYLLFAVLCAFISIIGKKIYFAFEDFQTNTKHLIPKRLPEVYCSEFLFSSYHHFSVKDTTAFSSYCKITTNFSNPTGFSPERSVHGWWSHLHYFWSSSKSQLHPSPLAAAEMEECSVRHFLWEQCSASPIHEPSICSALPN